MQLQSEFFSRHPYLAKRSRHYNSGWNQSTNHTGHIACPERVMLGDITQARDIYIACGYTDMRKSIDGLAAIVQQQFQLDPFARDLFLFCGRKRDRIKALLCLLDGRCEISNNHFPGAIKRNCIVPTKIETEDTNYRPADRRSFFTRQGSMLLGAYLIYTKPL